MGSQAVNYRRDGMEVRVGGGAACELVLGAPWRVGGGERPRHRCWSADGTDSGLAAAVAGSAAGRLIVARAELRHQKKPTMRTTTAAIAAALALAASDVLGKLAA